MTVPVASVRETAVRTLRAARAATGQLVGGLGTAFQALGVLVLLAVAAVTAPAGVGLLLAPAALRAVHALARRERARLSARGIEIVPPDPPPTRLRLALADPTTRRELGWLVRHATLGFLLGLLGLLLPLCAVRDTTFPLWWRLSPGEATTTSIGIGTAHGWPDALAATLLGVGWTAIVLGLGPGMARLQAAPARRLLVAGPGTDLSLRVAELTATRAAALDAHATELRRIERSLHDGAQNRLVSVTVLLGAARRMAARDPAGADELLERAQSAAEQALAELRQVARGILPPVLADRGLAGALSGLAADCGVPCRVEADVPERCAASVEATAYFVVAEALTNIAKHSGAARASVTARARGGRLRLLVEDDGRGGADEDAGSGLTGIRRRVAALDGTLRLTSPPGGPTVLDVDLPCGR
ncbi:MULTISPECIES: sensor histidine kinase [Streptomyces]|uniref:histidine kinase n=1 Tax=Streptomyces coelicolor (strain ATCC BAA-471 / A3(2) / M145) TaxID=100226 RepID=Q9L0V5_STRCO|nr:MULTISPECIES: sensor histidine kinase [Streptomyces]MDX2924487.1 sensor domain-containing protein [Streptomyces sp. NRRL_B-16638]MDX3410806.1 sensor domain-containing protein [Streptomyces sp. ME02-6977A]MYU43272.1 sensor histidine kinase [Streptomyces sp. SID7813]NSL78949.1 sensor histidine kinase [Streptomyces coelicolor]QFI43760.1 sensor histidine kinase [Streptomyces coelicolor A3(2)]